MQDAELDEFLTILKTTKWVVLDTETTDVTDPEILDLAIIDGETEAVLFNSRFNPITPINSEAARVNHISADDLKVEPCFKDQYSVIAQLLTDKEVVIWNAKFDYNALIQTCHVHGVDPSFLSLNNFWCGMTFYGMESGETNHRGEPKWFKLSNASLREKVTAGPPHRALGDCLTTARVIKSMLNRQ